MPGNAHGVPGEQRFQEELEHTEDVETSQHYFREGTGRSEASNGPKQSSRKRSYQSRARGFEYGGRPVGGTAGTRTHMPLNAVYNSARSFIHEGPSAAMQELGAMGPIGLTVFLIALIQYRRAILNSVRRTKHRLEDMWYYGDGLFATLSDLYGYVRFAFLVALDTIASLRLILPVYGGIDDDDSVGGLGTRGDDDMREAAGRRRGGRRRRLYERDSESATTSIPELELIPQPGGSRTSSRGSDGNSKPNAEKRRCRLCGLIHIRGGRTLVNGGYCHGIDPAFLNLKDYPSGWLVYDPIYGVLPKSIADKKRAAAEQESTEEKKEIEVD